MAVKKKILFLITKSNFGGAQRYVLDLSSSLPKERYEVVVVLGGNGILIKKLSTAGIRVIQINSLQRDISLLKELKSFWEIGRIIREERPDILHINSSKAGGLGAVIGRTLMVPKIIFTAHGWAFNENRSIWQKWIFKFIHWLTVLFSHQTITVSNELKRQMDWPLPRNKMVTIYLGRRKIEMFEQKIARNELTKAHPQLLAHINDLWSVSIGELHPIKQHEVTIKAVGLMKNRYPNYRHIIIGGGMERTKLEKLIADYSLKNNVFLVGHIDEAARFLKAFNLFVLPSKSEALAYVVIEAASAPLPIVASRVGGVPEVVEDKLSALLFNSGDYETLAQLITGLIQDEVKRNFLAKNAYQKSLQFDFSSMLEKTISVYED